MAKYNLPNLRPETARQYAFYQVPKLLLDHKAFDEIDYGAKLLYSRLLNRADLSAVNAHQFTDDAGDLYIIYTIEQVMEDMRCSKSTAVKMMFQLAEFGLIEKIRQGQGLPSIIYVKDFAAIQYIFSIENSARSPKNRLQEVHNTDFKKSTILTSRSSRIRHQEVKNIDSSNTNLSDTNSSETDTNYNQSILEGRNEILSDKKLLNEIKKNLLENGLPYKYKDDPLKMEVAILLLTDYLKLGKYDRQPSGGFRDNSDQNAYQICVDALVELCTMKNEITLAKQKVTAPKVIDRINNALVYGDNTVQLNGHIDAAIENFKQGLAKTKVKNPYTYMQAIVWQALLTGRAEEPASDQNKYTSGKYGHLIQR